MHTSSTGFPPQPAGIEHIHKYLLQDTLSGFKEGVTNAIKEEGGNTNATNHWEKNKISHKFDDRRSIKSVKLLKLRLHVYFLTRIRADSVLLELINSIMLGSLTVKCQVNSRCGLFGTPNCRLVLGGGGKEKCDMVTRNMISCMDSECISVL